MVLPTETHDHYLILVRSTSVYSYIFEGLLWSVATSPVPVLGPKPKTDCRPVPLQLFMVVSIIKKSVEDWTYVNLVFVERA